jgi:hypothetical protein
VAVSTPPRGCETCGAAVAPTLRAFHREWHATQAGHGRQYWEPLPDPSLDHLTRVIAALKALRPVSARPEFVADLRARLIADATANRLDPLYGDRRRGPGGVPSRRLELVRDASAPPQVSTHD